MGASAYSLAKLREALAAEGISDTSLDTRLDTLEANTLDARLDALEALGIDARIDALEAAGGGGGPIPRAKLTKSATQALVQNVETKVTYDGVEYDVEHGGTPHFDDANDRLVCRVPGLYIVVSRLQWGTAATSNTYKHNKVFKGGVAGELILEARISALTGVGWHDTRAGLVEMDADEYLEQFSLDNASSPPALSATTTTAGCSFEFARLGDIV
jgi:hypothetical protein